MCPSFITPESHSPNRRAVLAISHCRFAQESSAPKMQRDGDAALCRGLRAHPLHQRAVKAQVDPDSTHRWMKEGLRSQLMQCDRFMLREAADRHRDFENSVGCEILLFAKRHSRQLSMRILFALPGLHRHNRGAEVAFISLAEELTRFGETVTLIGSGTHRGSTPYRFVSAGSLTRESFESFPSIPFLRNDCAYEELTFVPCLLKTYRPKDYDITLTCGYPFVNWTLRRPTLRGYRPPHVFVTQNGDWPAYAKNAEYQILRM